MLAVLRIDPVARDAEVVRFDGPADAPGGRAVVAYDVEAPRTADGDGRTGTTDGRPCVACAGSGLVTADAAKTIVDSEEMEAGPKGDG